MTENEFEMAQRIEEAARNAGIARSRAAMAAMGTVECVDCECVIPAARRAALPSAIRCAGCQTLFERAARG